MDFSKIRKHPLWVIAFGNSWDTFSYFGTQTILALYLIHVFHFPKHTAYLLYGAYATFSFSLPILGGVIADRWLNSKITIVTGLLLNIAGNLVMISLQQTWFCVGIGLSLVGAAFYKSNSVQLVGSLYKIDNQKKERAYTYVYLAVNLGGSLAPVLYGFVAYALGWNYIFLLSAAGISLSLFVFLLYWRIWDLNDPNAKRPLKITKPILCTTLAIATISLCFYNPKIFTFLILTFFTLSFSYLILLINKQEGSTKYHLIALSLICFFALFYFTAGLQIGTTITLFIQYKIHQGIIHTHLPASIFSMLYCAFVLLLSPFITALWKKISTPKNPLNPTYKIALGIGLAGIGITLFAIVSIENWAILGIIVGILFLSAGELVLTPAVYTFISDKSPYELKSTMMGFWYLFIGLGGYSSSVLASASHWVANKFPLHRNLFSTEFIFIAAFVFLIAFIVLCFAPKLIRLMNYDALNSPKTRPSNATPSC